MSNNAIEYADSLTAQIRANTDAGFPFGVRHAEEDYVYSDMEDALSQHGDSSEDDFVEASGMDYLSDVLDIQYLVSSDRQYRAARICIAFGGPTAWINTQTSQLEVAWWSATEYRDLPREFIDGLDDALEELWDMGV